MTTLYRLYAPTGRLLYVGITDDWSKRRAQHAVDKDWWHLVDQVALVEFEDRATAIEAERRAVRAEQPVHNVVGSGLRAGDVLDRSPRIDWRCDLCGRPIADGKGALYGKRFSSGKWRLRDFAVLHAKGCGAPEKDAPGVHRYPIEQMRTVDRFLMTLWLVLDEDYMTHMTLMKVISNARASASYHVGDQS